MDEVLKPIGKDRCRHGNDRFHCTKCEESFWRNMELIFGTGKRKGVPEPQEVGREVKQ